MVRPPVGLLGAPVGPITVLPIHCDGGFIYLDPPEAEERGKTGSAAGRFVSEKPYKRIGPAKWVTPSAGERIHMRGTP